MNAKLWIAALAVLFGCATAANGITLRASIGALAAPGPHFLSGDNDRPSRCDGFVNPQYALLPGCTDPDRGAGAVDDWQNSFDRALGMDAQLGLGMGFRERWTLELEYARASTGYDQTSLIEDPSGVPFTDIFGAELPTAEERIGDAAMDAAFANVRLRLDSRATLTPYVGIGLGVARMSIDYNVRWARATDPALMASATGLPNEPEVRRNLAGTVTRDAATLSDTVFGVQALAGFERPISDRLSFVLEARYRHLRTFTASDSYDALRSHSSNLRPDGSEPVAYRIATDDLGGLSLSAGFIFRLGNASAR